VSPDEMARSCLDAMEACREFDRRESDAKVTLVTPQGFKPPPKFPRGYLLQVKSDGAHLWHFPASRVLSWLQSNGLVAT
jgi:hypothetical protein